MNSTIFMGVATIVAVILGPILAVWVTRYMDRRRADKERKMDIFRTLMRTRRTKLTPEHVGALNLVEIEFIEHPSVVAAWKSYLSNLEESAPPVEERERFEEFSRRRDALLTKLIGEIAKVLDVKIEQLDILESNYVPQGWSDNEWEQTLIRRGLLNVLHGRSPIKIEPHTFRPEDSNSPYPPPPEIDTE